MAVISVNRLSSQSGSEKALELTEVYRVVLDDANTPLPEIMDHPDMPQYGSPHPEIGYIFCLDRKPAQDQDSRTVRDFNVEYGQIILDDDTIAKILQGGDPVALTQPELRPPKAAWRTVEVQKPLRYHRHRAGEVRDRNGVLSGALIVLTAGSPIRNTAGIEPEVPGTYRAFNRVLSFTRFETTFSDPYARQYLGHVNSASFGGTEDYTVLCTLFDAEEVYVQNGTEVRKLYAVSYAFEHDMEGHWQDVPNVSGEYFDGTDYEPILDKSGFPVRHPVQLKIDGTVKTAVEASTSEIFIRTYPYPEADLNDLGIDPGA